MLHIYGKYADVWAVTQARLLSEHRVPQGGERDFAVLWLVEYLETLQAGRMLARSYHTIERKLRRIDPTLRLRLDYEKDMYAVDRYAPDLGCMLTIFYWSHMMGEGGAICDVLNSSDMQRWASPEEYHQNKRRLQQQALNIQDKRRSEMCLQAVDSLSRAQIAEFCAVERAMQIGEKIHLRGEDSKFVQKQYERTKQGLIPALPSERHCVNPHMHPFRHRRMNRAEY